MVHEVSWSTWKTLHSSLGSPVPSHAYTGSEQTLAVHDAVLVYTGGRSRVFFAALAKDSADWVDWDANYRPGSLEGLFAGDAEGLASGVGSLGEVSLAPGTVVSVGSQASATAFATKLTDGATETMRVNGSGAPKVYQVTAESGGGAKDLVLSELRIVFVVNSIKIDGASFGRQSGLTNGLLMEAVVNGGTAVALGNIRSNEGLLELSGRLAIDHGLNDTVVASLALGGPMRLLKGTGDLLKITVRDNITHSSFKYLRATLYGTKE